MTATSVVPLITLWEEFSQLNPSGDLQSFARWIIKEKQDSPVTTSAKKKKENFSKNDMNLELKEESKAMLLIYRLHRFMEIRSKPVIKKIGFAKPQEYAMLAEVCLLRNPNKKEVAKKMLLENSTAVEISKRLAQRGFIKEVADPNDKRATRLLVTDKGMKKLLESYEGLEKVHENFLDCLTEKEKKELIRLLEELEKFQSALTGSLNRKLKGVLR
jgi:DNA-binding MarR family transcriptional regulator